MWIDDASREVKDRVLQGQQPHPTVSAGVLHIPRFHISTEEGTEQTTPDFHQFPAGGWSAEGKYKLDVIVGTRSNGQRRRVASGRTASSVPSRSSPTSYLPTIRPKSRRGCRRRRSSTKSVLRRLPAMRSSARSFCPVRNTRSVVKALKVTSSTEPTSYYSLVQSSPLPKTWMWPTANLRILHESRAILKLSAM